MPKLVGYRVCEGEKKRENTEGLKAKYGKCQTAGTESATLHGGFEKASAGSRHCQYCIATQKASLSSFMTVAEPMADPWRISL